MDLTKSVTDCPHRSLPPRPPPPPFTLPPAGRQSGPRRIARSADVRDVGTLPGYKVRPMFDVRSGALVDRLIFLVRREREAIRE